MNIYTRTGDKGETSLIGGKRVKKYHLRVEAYGTVDELNSWLGLIRDLNPGKKYYDLLIEIQNKLMCIASRLASEENATSIHIPELKPTDIELLEKEIDAIFNAIPPLRNFVLPGGQIIVSHCHIARCVCRRTERLIVRLAEDEQVGQDILKYINRLSDFLFALSRFLVYENKVQEIIWKP